MSSYPNIEAIAAGTISGAFREWPKVQPEAKALLADYSAAVAEVQKYPGHHPGLSLAENVRELVRDLAAAEAIEDGIVAALGAEVQALRAALQSIADPAVPNNLGLPESRLYLAQQIARAALAQKARP